MSFTGLGLASYASGGLGEERCFVPPDQKRIRSLTDLAAGRLSSACLNFHSSGWPGGAACLLEAVEAVWAGAACHDPPLSRAAASGVPLLSRGPEPLNRKP